MNIISIQTKERRGLSVTPHIVRLKILLAALLLLTSCSNEAGSEPSDADVSLDTSDADTRDTGEADVPDTGGLGDLPSLPAIQCDSSGEPGEHVSSESYKDIDPGQGFGCGLQSDGDVVCWGDTAPAGIEEASGDYVEIKTADSAACTLDSEGTIDCWGGSTFGLNDPPNPEGRAWQSFEIGSSHACGIYEDNGVGCWGRDSPARDAPAFKFNAVAVSFDATCGIKRSDHTIECWGEDMDGQLDAPSGKFAAIDGGGRSFCALTYDGTPKCWGLVGEHEPPEGKKFSDIQAVAYACGHGSTGVPSCWPSENNGDMLEPTGSENRCFEKWRVGTSYACGLRADDRVECFGKPNTQMDGRLEVP